MAKLNQDFATRRFKHWLAFWSRESGVSLTKDEADTFLAMADACSSRTANAASGLNAAREIGSGIVSLVARPNPFNPRTKIEFGLPREGRVTLRVYDIQGRLVSTLVNGRMNAGNHTVELNGDKLPSGVYMMRLQREDGAEVNRRITLLK